MLDPPQLFHKLYIFSQSFLGSFDAVHTYFCRKMSNFAFPPDELLANTESESLYAYELIECLMNKGVRIWLYFSSV